MSTLIETRSARVTDTPRGRVGHRFRGAFVTRSLFDADAIRRLAAEAARGRAGADHQETLVDDLYDGRGGQPARRLLSTQGGPVQDAGYSDADVTRKLSSVTGLDVRQSGGRGSYSFYEGGHFLALHRDILTCDLSVITVLSDDSDPKDPAGGLLFYPDRCDEPLSAIRHTPRDGAHVLKARPGETVVIAGGEVAHRVLPMAPGRTRVISVLCFRAT